MRLSFLVIYRLELSWGQAVICMLHLVYYVVTVKDGTALRRPLGETEWVGKKRGTFYWRTTGGNLSSN